MKATLLHTHYRNRQDIYKLIWWTNEVWNCKSASCEVNWLNFDHYSAAM